MNRIDSRFAELKERGETALIPFITVGDPDLDTSVAIIQEMEKAGAAMVELGVPYSDPLADGPVIQRSSMRALQNNQVSVLDVIRIAGKARAAGSQLPFILFTYYNPLLQLGMDKLFNELKANDISGLIVPDLPMEEDEALKALAEENGVHLIPLVAPTSKDRIKKIVSRATGFIYCVSSLGVTGVRSQFHTGIDDFIASVRSNTTLPVAVGFGISNKEQFDRFAGTCDGVVVGSAIVRKVEEAMEEFKQSGNLDQALEQIRDFVAGLKGTTTYAR